MNHLTWASKPLIHPDRYEDWARQLRLPNKLAVKKEQARAISTNGALVETDGAVIKNAVKVHIEISDKVFATAGAAVPKNGLLDNLRWLQEQIERGNTATLRIGMKEVESQRLDIAILSAKHTQKVQKNYWVYLEEDKVIKNGKYITHERFTIEYASPRLETFQPLADRQKVNVFSLKSFNRSDGKVAIGIIDDAIAFANSRFQHLGDDAQLQTRFEHIWLQTPENNDEQEQEGSSVDFGYALSKDELQKLLLNNQNSHTNEINEGRVYQTVSQRFKNINFNLNLPHWGHGTHVLDVATGYDPSDPTGNKRPIFAVQLPTAVTANTSGRYLASYALQGLQQIIDWADEFLVETENIPPVQKLIIKSFNESNPLPTSNNSNEGTAKDEIETEDFNHLIPLVINFSYGFQAGPKDGSTFFERQIDRLIKDRRDRGGITEVILPAGNSYDDRTHANYQLKSNDNQEIAWIIHPDDRTESFVEIWLPRGTYDRAIHPIEIELLPPKKSVTIAGKSTSNDFVCLSLGEENVDYPIAGIYFDWNDPSPNNGEVKETRPRLLLCVNRTQDRDAITNKIIPSQSGEWKIKLTNKLKKTLDVDLYIQRDDTLSGYQIGGRQSYFDDKNAHEKSKTTGAYDALDKKNCPISGEGSLTAMGGGTLPIVVGAANLTSHTIKNANTPADALNLEPSSYTSAGPTPSKQGPNASALVDFGNSYPGLYATGIRSGTSVLMNGTSVAAPLFTRAIADVMSETDNGLIELEKKSETLKNNNMRLGAFVIKPEVSSSNTSEPFYEIKNKKRKLAI